MPSAVYPAGRESPTYQLQELLSDELLGLVSTPPVTNTTTLAAVTVTTGILTILPSELIGAIVDALLRLPADVDWDIRPHALETIQAVRNFALTCRGVAVAIDVDHISELRSRKLMHTAPNDYHMSHPTPYAWLLVKSCLAWVEVGALQQMLTNGLGHCASTTGGCCRSIRAAHNDKYDGWHAYLESIGNSRQHDILSGVAEPNAKMRLNVVVEDPRAMLIGTTHNGALVASRGQVLRITASPAPEFTPGLEMHVTMRVDVEGRYCWAIEHPDGTISVCSDDSPNANGTNHAYTITTWSQDGTHILFREQIKPHRDFADPALGPIENMWAHGTDVWMACLAPWSPPDDPNREMEMLQLIGIRRDGGLDTFRQVPPCDSFVDLAVARGVGHCAFIDCNDQMYTANLHYFNTSTGQLSYRVDKQLPNYMDHGIMDTVALSRDARIMVATGRCYNEQLVYIYRRTAPGPHGFVRWQRLDIGGAYPRSYLPGLAVPLHDRCELYCGQISPCGSMLLLMYRDGTTEPRVPGNLIVLNLNATIARKSFHYYLSMIPAGAVPLRLMWSNGIFVQAAQGGVLRLGLVKPPQA